MRRASPLKAAREKLEKIDREARENKARLKAETKSKAEKLEAKAKAKSEKVEAEAKAKSEKLKNQIKRLEQRDKAKERKVDTRRKILAGSMVLERMQKDPAFAEKFKNDLDRFLTRDIDRELFGLNSRNTNNDDTLVG
jgi:regulator of protease activity HflC (stomatin/prohibitin superfamily)